MTTADAVSPSFRTAWYLRCRADQIAERAVLVGDRGRVLLAADLLDEAQILNEDRGLTTTTGSWRGVPITVSAFGMGAPIAGVVLHELVSLGVTSVVRLGTALTMGETELGELIVADGAIRGEATSGTYVPQGYPASPDLGLAAAMFRAGRATGRSVRYGLIASYDGFYSQMFPDGTIPAPNAVDLADLGEKGVIGLDMETSAVLAIGRALGVRAASFCLASVSGHNHETLDPRERTRAERDLLTAGFDGLVNGPQFQS